MRSSELADIEGLRPGLCHPLEESSGCARNMFTEDNKPARLLLDAPAQSDIQRCALRGVLEVIA
jgi:hypothetical protein